MLRSVGQQRLRVAAERRGCGSTLAHCATAPATVAVATRLGLPTRRAALYVARSSASGDAGRDTAASTRRGATARYKRAGAVEADTEETELEYLHLDYDFTELLDLHGRDSYLLCDVTMAHDRLLALPLPEGYSNDVVDGRRALLDHAKERVLYNEGRVMHGPNKGIDVPVHLLPSALALLAQLNQNAAVSELASKLLDNWDMRRTYKRDLTLSLAIVRCNIARELLADQKVAEGCASLEEALGLLQGAGSPALAPQLATDISAAVDGFAVQRVLDQLRSTSPTAPDAASARRRALRMLRELLARSSTASAPTRARGGLLGSEAGGAGSGVTADYVRLVVDCLGSWELTAMADWDAVARSPSSAHWLYPGLLQIAATAHIAAGFRQRAPAAVRTALALLRGLPSSAEVLLLRGVGAVLLGDPTTGVASIKAAALAPADRYISWPADVTSETVAEGAPPAPRLPAPAQAAAFLSTHSEPEDAEMLGGLCLYTELFLARVVFAGFPDTAGAASGEGGAAAAPSLLAYYDSDAVQDALAEDAERGAGGPADSLAAGLAGLAAVAGVLRSSVRPLVDQLAEAAGSAGSALGAQLSGASGVSSRRSMADRLASELADAQNPVDLDRGSGSPWPLEEDAAGAGAVGSPVGGLVSRIASAGGVLRGTLAARFGAAWPAAAAAGALGAAVLFATLSRRGVGSPLAPPAPHAVTRTAARRGTEAAAPAATRVLSRGDATRLVRRFQAAKSAALGSAFDESQLPAVCTGPALSHFAAASRDWAARGWFRTSKLWKLDVTDVRPAGRSGTRVRIDATLGESVKTWGVDGQAGTAWSNEYGVEYDVSLGADGQWRIQGVTVRGAAPGERSGWLGMFGGSK